MPSRPDAPSWEPRTRWPVYPVSTSTIYTRQDTILWPFNLVIGTIRGDFALAVGRNVCHGSDSVENAEKEIKLYVFQFYCHTLRLTQVLFFRWFTEGTIQYTDVKAEWIFE